MFKTDNEGRVCVNITTPYKKKKNFTCVVVRWLFDHSSSLVYYYNKVENYDKPLYRKTFLSKTIDFRIFLNQWQNSLNGSQNC